ncbi:hypothetical protein FFI97_006005 [Variovorax sp. KBS0712]|uniref:hypothetical protein n=1 Tax=Variovorax sp. KBS0712 TaxID=2578111 RepID=UPI0011183C94|nr:hypothetical protein [Variovorax sp. KBS0712]TSD59862.1 hypothetical protein FFI97_006005 [Variovorax sp. KBS0712]
MTDSMRITDPVEIKTDSQQRVAFELMTMIHNFEPKDKHPKTREYFLKLYAQCYSVTIGRTSARAISGEPDSQ